MAWVGPKWDFLDAYGRVSGCSWLFVHTSGHWNGSASIDSDPMFIHV